MSHPTENDDYELNWLERFAVSTLKQGRMPKHVAIILDGNRRFARKSKLKTVLEGHKRGADKLNLICEILEAMGVEELTVYAFSIENFKRAKQEVDGLMQLVAEKMQYKNKKKCESGKGKGSFTEVVGNLELATPTLQNILKQSMLISRKLGGSLKLTLAFIYTGRNEILQGANRLLQGLSKGQLETSDVSPKVMEKLFTLFPSSPVDILIRTSGECRLSDFLLWGSSDAYIDFVQGDWPEFTFWGLVMVIFRYQHEILRRRWMGTSWWTGGERCSQKSDEFVKMVRENRWNELIASGAGPN